MREPDVIISREAEAGEVAYFQVTDTFFDPGRNRWVDESHRKLIGLARQNGLRLYLAFECLEGDRKTIRGTRGAGDFRDGEYRDAFRKAVMERVREYKPEYVNLCVELNMLPTIDSAVDDFLPLYEQTYDEIKGISPHTKVFVSFQYEILASGTQDASEWMRIPNATGSADGKRIQLSVFRNLEPHLDVIGISTYPRIFTSPYAPQDIPDDYFTLVFNETRKPVFIAETGAYSSGKNTIPSSEETQAAYLRRLYQLLNGRNVEAIMYVSLLDVDESEVPGLPSQFYTLGLLGSEGAEKDAWTVWAGIKNKSITGPVGVDST